MRCKIEVKIKNQYTCGPKITESQTVTNDHTIHPHPHTTNTRARAHTHTPNTRTHNARTHITYNIRTHAYHTHHASARTPHARTHTTNTHAHTNHTHYTRTHANHAHAHTHHLLTLHPHTHTQTHSQHSKVNSMVYHMGLGDRQTFRLYKGSSMPHEHNFKPKKTVQEYSRIKPYKEPSFTPPRRMKASDRNTTTSR